MDKINSAISEKILEISNSETYDVKEKLQKINRFRDFVSACQTLIRKYPEIEIEFLRMINSGDFDARIAAMRVDRIIQEHEDKTIDNALKDKQEDISQLNEIIDNLPVKNQPDNNSTEVAEARIESPDQQTDEQVLITLNTPIIKDEKTTANNNTTITDAEDTNSEYIDYIEIPATPTSDTPPIESEPKNNSTAKKIIYLVGAIVCIIILIYVTKFIINNWQTILYILTGCILLLGIGWYFMKRKK